MQHIPVLKEIFRVLKAYGYYEARLKLIGSEKFYRIRRDKEAPEA